MFEGLTDDQTFVAVIQAEMARKIHIDCGSCGRGLQVSLRMAGRKTTCPACGERIRIPYAGQEAERKIEELIAARSPKVRPGEPVAAAGPAGKPGMVVPVDEFELVELAKYVETDGISDAIELQIPEEDEFRYGQADVMDGREILALNEAISAFTAPRSGSAAQDLPALSRAARAQRSAPREVGRPRQKTAMLVVLGAAVCIALGAWLAVKLSSRPRTDTDTTEDNIASLLPNKGGNGGSATQSNNPTTRKTAGQPYTKPKAVAVCRTLLTSSDSFASEGFFPAKPGWMFCRVMLEVTAGDDPLEFDTYGPGASLEFATRTYYSLGEPVRSIVPVLPQRRHLTVPPGESRELTLLFQLPHTAVGPKGAKGQLTLGKISLVPVLLGSPAHVQPAEAVVDASESYVEVVPRNTKPLLDDPVMSAIQQTMPQKLSVRPGADDSSVKLSFGGQVTGTAKRDDRGIYVAQLTHEGRKLDCLLHFAHGGKEAILYLSEEPFHQITFAIPGWTRTVPVTTQGQSSRSKPPVRPVNPRPTTRPRPKPNTGGPRRPGFFGV